MHESDLLQRVVEILVAFAHLLVQRNLKLVHNLVRQRGEDQIGLARGHAVLHRLLRIERAEPDIHQRVRLHNMGR